MGIQVAPRISFRQMHDMALGKSLSYVFVPAYSASQSFVFVLIVVFNLLRSQVLIPYLSEEVFSYFDVNANPFDHQVCHLNFFPTCVLLFKWVRSFQHSQDQPSVFPNVGRLIRPKLSLFSPPSHPFSSRTQIS